MLGWVPRKIKQNLRPWMINKKDFGSEIASVFVMSADAWEKANLITENEVADGGTSGDLKGASEYLRGLRRLMAGLCYVNFPLCVMVSLFLDMGISKRILPLMCSFYTCTRRHESLQLHCDSGHFGPTREVEERRRWFHSTWARGGKGGAGAGLGWRKPAISDCERWGLQSNPCWRK